MTSKKRVEIGSDEGGVESKRPRGNGEEVEEIKTESEEVEVATATRAPALGAAAVAGRVVTGEDSPAAPPSQRRNNSTSQDHHHRDYLQYSGGRRAPRIGDDFQVSILPSPGDTSSNNNNKGLDSAEEKGEKKEDS